MSAPAILNGGYGAAAMSLVGRYGKLCILPQRHGALLTAFAAQVHACGAIQDNVGDTNADDLRHPCPGVVIDQAMLSLSTYVGHAMVTNTYWYLTAIPELMAIAAKKFESRMAPPGARHA